MRQGKLILLASVSLPFLMTGVAAQAAPLAAGAAIGDVDGADVAVKHVRDTTLNAIRDVSPTGKVADFEGVILFALDNLKETPAEIDAGLLAAYEVTPDGPARVAIANIRAMRARVKGTGAIYSGVSSGLSFGPGIGGGGGTSNYSR